MTDPVRHYAYSGENALHLYHLFVNELDSKIVNGFLNIGSFHLRIKNNENIEKGDDEYRELGRFVHYYYNDDIRQYERFYILIQIFQGDSPHFNLKIDHFTTRGYRLFSFPLNNVIVKEQPISCFNKWMEIAVNGMPTLDQVAEFDRFIEIEKEHRDFKKKINFLQLSLNKSRPHSLLNGIISNEHLKDEIFKNGSRHQ